MVNNLLQSSVGERLRLERERLFLKQTDLTDAAGIKRTAQWSYESDRSSPTIAYLSAIATLGVDVSYVVTGVRSARLPGTTDEEREEIDALIGIYLYSGDEDRIRLMAYATAIGDAGQRAGRARHQIRGLQPRAAASTGSESPAPTSDEAQS